MFHVEYYGQNKRYPVLDFLRSLSPKEQAKVLREIELLEEFGLALGMPHIRKMHGTDDIWELRIKHSSNNFRIFYFCVTDNRFVLLHAIRKTTSKTPIKDLSLASARKKRYLEGKQP